MPRCFLREALDCGAVETHWELQSLPLAYTRRISLDGEAVRIEFTLENLADHPTPFLWALHPFFAVTEGDRFSADFGEAPLEIFAAPGLNQLSKGDSIAWPGREAGIDLSRLSLGDVPMAGIKFFGASPDGGRLALWNINSGARLEVHYDAENLPWLAVWLSRGVWGGAHHIVIEPTNRSGETLQPENSDDAHAIRSALLQPHEIRKWSVTFRNASAEPGPIGE